MRGECQYIKNLPIPFIQIFLFDKNTNLLYFLDVLGGDMNIKTALFLSVAELSHVLDKGVCIEFRKMVLKGGIYAEAVDPIGEARSKYLIYVRSWPWYGSDESEICPRPTTELEEILVTIAHELVHITIIEAGLETPKTEDGEDASELAKQMDRHAYSLLEGNFFEELFFEIDKRKNCSIVFNASVFDDDGSIDCPFLPYYLGLTNQRLRPTFIA